MSELTKNILDALITCQHILFQQLGFGGYWNA